MAIETTFNIRASAKGFTEAGRAIDDLNKKLKETGPDGGRLPGGRHFPGKGPAVIPQRPNPYMPGPGGYRPIPGGGQGPMPVRPGFTPGAGPAVVPQFGLGNAPGPGRGPNLPGIPSPSAPGVGPATPDPQSTIPGGGDGEGGGGGRSPRRMGGKKALAALQALMAGYRAVAEAAEAANKQILQVNTNVAAGMGDFRELAGLFRGRRSGGGDSGGGPGSGAGAPGGGASQPRRRVGPPEEPLAASLGKRFSQGFLEGLLPNIGGLAEGGRGGLYQFGGRVAARAATSLGGFLQSGIQAPFRGIGGVQDFISRVPLLGGTLASASAQAFQNAGTAIGFEGQQQASLPYLGRTGVNALNLGALGTPRYGFDELSANGLRRAGMGGQQTQQYLTSLAQASGSTADNHLVGGSLDASLSAYSRFGVGPEVMGSFVRGQRQQGTNPNVGIDGFIRSLAAGNQGLGLEGTELTDYMRQMAEDIASFTTTGIPIATESIGALGMSFAASGITGSRASGLAGNFDRLAQNVGNNGPQSVQDYALLQAVAGRPLNGIDDTIDTMDQLAGGLSPQDTQKTFRNLMQFAGQRYGSDKKGQFAQRQFFSGLGLNFNSKEYAGLLSSKDPTLSDNQIAAFHNRMETEGYSNVSTVTQAQAGLDNANLSLGMRGLETYFKSEQFHKDLSQGIVTGLLPYVNKMNQLVTGLYDTVVGRKAATNSLSPAQAVTRGAPR